MIRCIQRRLIIPRGDTGSFIVPVLADFNENDLAVFSIFNPLNHTKVLEKQILIEGNELEIKFSHNETVNLKPGKYLWDIKFYKEPQFLNGVLIGGNEVHSYYAGYSLPTCEIRDTSDSFLIGENITLDSNKIELLSTLIGKVEEIANQAEENVNHYPKIINGFWYVWNTAIQDYTNTGARANGDDNVASIELENDNASIKINYVDGEVKQIPLIGFDHLQFLKNTELILDANSLNDFSSNTNSLDDNFYSPEI